MATIPCRNGPSCKYLGYGACRFFHPDEHLPRCLSCNVTVSFSGMRCSPCLQTHLDSKVMSVCIVCSSEYSYTLRDLHGYADDSKDIRKKLCNYCKPIRSLLRDALGGKEVNLGCREYDDIVFRLKYQFEADEHEYYTEEEHTLIMPILTCFKEADLAELTDPTVDYWEKSTKNYWSIIRLLYEFRGPFLNQAKFTAWMDKCWVSSVEVISRWSLYVPGYPIESAYRRRRFALLGMLG